MTAAVLMSSVLGFVYLDMALVRRDVDRRQPLLPLLFVRVRAVLQQQPHLHHHHHTNRQEVMSGK